MKRLVFGASFLCMLVTPCVWAADDIFVPFCKSFVDGLSFNPESRFVHEYHPYLLRKTQESLKQLESFVGSSGFTIAHRMVILGYEQQAVPAYFNCLSGDHIDDEVVLKTKSGFEFTPGNVSGFLTGYLFKDANQASQQVIEHIVPERVELFGSQTTILQKHAFGAWYDTLLGYQEVVQKCLYEGKTAQALRHLTEFWQHIYEDRGQGGQQYRATQDLLFSFYYIKYLLDSSIVLNKVFVGPDITYPIEVNEQQSADVTQNAQAFVERFSRELKPINGQKTAYIFCSFVDGVGKSTLLGNICNWHKHQDDFNAYQHVSNASSQSATLYQLTDDVAIVDLPAQISHYCAKPDGSVYVDLGYTTLAAEKKDAVRAYAAANASSIIASGEQQLKKGTAAVDAKTPEERVMQIVARLETPSVWRPFEFEGQHYVLNMNDPRQVRMLMAFDAVHSQGLKIKEPELMLFDKGLAIPMNYQAFLNDLTKKMHGAGIQQVVFVDFASLYPRTSRETVRINYIIQLLKTFYNDEFSVKRSMYWPFGHAHEVYPLFFDYRDAFERNVFLEVLLRYVIFDVISAASRDGISFLSKDEVQKQLKARIGQIYGSQKVALDEVLRAVRKRIEQELPVVAPYQMSKFYEAVSRFSIKRFAGVGAMVHQLVAQYHPHDGVRAAFAQLDADLEKISPDGKTATLANGVALEVVRPLREYEMDEPLIEAVVDELRGSWYDQVVGIVVNELIDSYMRSYVIKQDKAGEWYLLAYKACQDQGYGLTLLPEVSTFDIGDPSRWNPDEAGYICEIVEQVRRQFKREGGVATEYLFAPTSAVCAELDQGKTWQSAGVRTKDMILPKIAQVPQEVLQLIVRALATIHFIVKSPSDEIMVRYGNQDDFVAAIRLLEDLVVPKYFDIPLKEQLFDDYTGIVPLVGEFAQKA